MKPSENAGIVSEPVTRLVLEAFEKREKRERASHTIGSGSLRKTRET